MAGKWPECLGIAKISARNWVKCGGSGEVIIHSHLHTDDDRGEGSSPSASGRTRPADKSVPMTMNIPVDSGPGCIS